MPGPDEQKREQEELLKSPKAKHFMEFLLGGSKKENPEDIQCPVCGFYCIGNGGVGCINKPKLCGL